MLHLHFSQFLDYCKLAEFSECSFQALTIRMNKFETCLKSQRIRSVKKITCRHLIDFVADYENSSIHVRKSLAWTLRQFFTLIERKLKTAKG